MSNAEILSQESSELRELDWVKNQIKAELASLQTEAFYNKNEQTGKIDYNLSTVKSYLETVQDQDRKKLISKNSSAFMMAVQIALESQGYDVGKIDGLRGRATMLQVQSFQKAKGLKADGLPGPETIAKMLEQLGTVSTGAVTPPVEQVEEPGADEAEQTTQKSAQPEAPAQKPAQPQIPETPKAPDHSETIEALPSLDEIDLSKLGSWQGGEWKFKAGVEKEDDQGIYIQLGNEKYYKDNEDGYGYHISVYAGSDARMILNVGRYKEGEINGKGKFYYGYDSSVRTNAYEGWEKGIWKNGELFQGEVLTINSSNNKKEYYRYENGKQVYKEFIDQQGRRSYEKGIFDNSWKLTGEGERLINTGVLEKGMFNEGQLDGDGERTFPDGRIRKGRFVKGEFKGISETINKKQRIKYVDKESGKISDKEVYTNKRPDFIKQADNKKEQDRSKERGIVSSTAESSDHGKNAVHTLSSRGQKIAYQESPEAFNFKTKSGLYLRLPKSLGAEGVKTAANLINAIVYKVKNNDKGWALDYFEADGNELQADYKVSPIDTTLLTDVQKFFKIPAKDLADWLNEYRKDVGI